MKETYSSFDSIWTYLCNKAVSFIASKKDTGIYIETDENYFFIKKIKDFFENKPSIFLDRSFKKNMSLPELSRTSAVFVLGDIKIGASGHELGYELSLLKTKGELLERLSSYVPLDLWRAASFDVKKLIKSLPQEIKSKSILTGETKKIPISDIFWGKAVAGESIRQNLTTSGAAGYYDEKTATLSAWLELIERDSFLVHWLTATSPRRILIEKYIINNNKSPLAKVVLKFKKYNCKYFFLDTTTDIGVPSAVCVILVSSPTGERMFLGASSGFNKEDILFSCATESLSVMLAHYEDPIFILEEEPSKQKDIIDRSARLSMYFTDDAVKKASFFFNGQDFVDFEKWFNEEIMPKTKNEKIEFLKEIFYKRSLLDSRYHVYVYSIKNKLLDYFSFYVVRVTCYALYPLYLKEKDIKIDHPRLREFSLFKGRGDIKVNILPHPFP